MGEAAIEPGWQVVDLVETLQLARAESADEIAHRAVASPSGVRSADAH